MKLLRLIGGSLLVIAGLILMVIPGPGIPVVALGFGLLSHDWPWAKRARDWSERRAKQGAGWLKRRWRQASVPLRVAVVALTACFASAAGYGAWRVVF